MKFPPTIASSIHRKRSGDQASAYGREARTLLLRWLRTPRIALGVAVLAAGITAGTLLSLPMVAASPTPSPAVSASAASAVRAARAAGTAPQLHVVGNKLISADGQQVMLHGVDRSGAEYECVQRHRIFDGPTSQASIKVMKSYGINAVRIPLNEACWNGESYVKPAVAGATYQAAVKAYVHRLNAAGMDVILDLHWTDGRYTGPASACSTAEATCQKPMPDAPESVRFWTSVATTFKGDDAVIFDLFNEPYPEKAAHGNPAKGWSCWLHGGADCAGLSYQAAGMQDLVNAVRSAGATNVLMLGGLEWSNDLRGWLSHEPADPDHNLAASWHSYNFNACSTQQCWTSQIAPVLAKVPVIAGEIGENDCSSGYVTPLTRWLNSEGASYLAWTWNADFNCWSGPGLITGYNGRPTNYGAGYEAALQDAPAH
jgi:endoglucanase